jgi:hypothetical protein
MEKEFNINRIYEDLIAELFEWYQLQGFHILNRIHETNLFDYLENELEYILDELREEWNDMDAESKIEFYNKYKDFKY